MKNFSHNLFPTLVFSFAYFLLSIDSCFPQGVWTQKADFPGEGRGDAFYFSINTKGYTGAGRDCFSNYKNDFWEYDALANTWTQKLDFAGTARWQSASFNIGTKGYICTGSNNNDFWEYEPTTNSWTQKSNLPAIGRSAAVGFSIGNNNGYVGTGYNAIPGYDDFWEYNQVTNSWTQKANVPGGDRTYAVGFSIGNKGYIGTGGNSTGNLFNDFWEYDATSNIWTQKTNFPGGKRNDIDGAHFTIGNYGYMGTGKNASIYFNDFWKYNSLNDTWTQIPNLSVSVRIGAIGFSINNKGYVGLGFSGPNACLNDLWEYSPDSIEDSVSKLTLPDGPTLGDAQPNPNNGSTQIPYYLPQNTGNAKIIFIDMLGRVMEEKDLQVGYGLLNIDSMELPPGVYSYSLIIDGKVRESKKMQRNK